MPLKESAQRVQDALRQKGFTNSVIELPDSTRTAQEAADAVGCSVAQIAKSLVFRTVHSGRPVLVIASGAGRVDEERIASLCGEPVEKPDAAFVRAATGFVIGGVPPIGHAQPLTTFIDQNLLSLDTLWAAAGHPKAVFPLTPDELVRMTGGQVVQVR
ncbi:YbaK/EbsC family protein [Alicyclobacillus macrosporangiidus]|jgi:prolyl-tRNA editing enzyme YbaK/EbsC (Cys-tRNA(Pro) deacylase)|uniref:Cys-tRNA(Pro) deacylase, prolyl-tRNA editing enzyme YbaK/EbsC n=1 Tax=Alicyclobacillus macrosporangiidus TaxID=392015 RepID=A0A1I7FBX8_9BACL|nr:YbaK/EbsC family protein [Alicyclobacillus macrosporangiidus]SFU33710.1 Cys-tRNA(Pro) deacylase, prolyl-tRNA editing enzyme YbaK/EbsC [Alicyclobacillus macrosporangiidus]